MIKTASLRERFFEDFQTNQQHVLEQKERPLAELAMLTGFILEDEQSSTVAQHNEWADQFKGAFTH